MRTNFVSIVAVAFTAGLALPACYNPTPANGSLQCSSTAPACPDGYVCAGNNHCYLNGTQPVEAAALQLTGLAATAQEGTALAFTLAAVDNTGAPVAGYLGTVHFTSSDPLAVLPADYTFTAADAGSHAFTATLKTLGPQTLTATDAISALSISGSVAVSAGNGASLAFRGTPATSAAGAALDFTLAILDSEGNAAAGYRGTVHFTSTDAQAQLPADYTFTAADSGTHAFSATLQTAGIATLTAQDAADALTVTSGNIDVTAGSAAGIALGAVPSSAPAGTAFSFTVTASDAFGNVAAGYTGKVHFTSTDPAAQLPSDYTFSSADAGSRTFIATLQTVGAQTLTVTDGADALSNTSGPIAVGAGAATQFLLSNIPSATVAGTAFGFSLSASDAFGNPATGYLGTVHFTSTDPQAQLPADYTFTAADAGTHLFSAAMTLAGSASLTATDTAQPTLTATSGAIVTSAAVASALTIAAAPSSATAGTAFTFKVVASDAFGNVATGYTGTVQFTSSDPGAAQLPANATFVAGQGSRSFSATLVTAGAQTLMAADTSNAAMHTSAAILVGAGALHALTITGVPSSGTAGVAIAPIVSAVDAYGNVFTAYNGTVQLSSSDSTVLAQNHTFTALDAGQYTFSATPKTAAAATTFTAHDTAFSLSVTSSGMTVTAATASSLGLTLGATQIVAGTPISATVSALDVFGNPDPSYRGVLHFTSTDANAAAQVPANYTFTAADKGVHTFNQGVLFATVGTQSIAATDGTLSTASPGPQVSVLPSTAASLQWSGPTIPVGVGAATALTLTATDYYGNVATGYTSKVTLTSSDSHATGLPSGGYTFTTADAGVHVFNLAFSASGAQTVTASDGLLSPSVFNIQISSGVATALQITGVAQTGTAGVAIAPVVTAVDGFGNVVTVYSGTIHFTSTDPQAALPPDYTFNGNDLGTHAFAATLKTAGTWTLTATDTSVSTLKGTSSAISVGAAAASTLAITQAPASTTAGVAFSFNVVASDTYGNVATGYTGTVHFSSTDPAAQLPANFTFLTGSGTHAFNATLVTAAAQTLSVVDAANPALQASATLAVQTAALHALVITGVPQSTVAGTALQPVVSAVDALGNLIKGYTGTVQLTSTDPTVTTTSHTFAAGDAGQFTFTVTPETAALATTFTAQDSVDALSTTSSAVAVSAAGAASLSIAYSNSQTTAGVALTMTVTALDAFGNTAPTYLGTVHFVSTDLGLHASVPADYTFVANDNGVHTFLLGALFVTAGEQSISASDGTLSTPSGATQIAVFAGSPTALSWTGPGTSIATGTSTALTLAAVDAYGNISSGYLGQVTLATSDSRATGLPASYAFVPGDAGAHVFNVTFGTSGAQNVTATDGLLPLATLDVQVTSGLVSALVVTNLASSTTAGTPLSPTVTAADSFGNPVPGYRGTIHFTSDDSRALLPGSYTFIAADNGTHAFPSGVTFETVGAHTVTVGDGSLSGTSSAVTVGAGALASFSITAPASTTAGTPISFTATALDAYGNTVTGYQGTVYTTSSDHLATLPGDTSFQAGDLGVHAFNNLVTLKTSGAQSLTITSSAQSSINGSANVQVGASSATQYAFSGLPGNVSAGLPLTLVVTARDAYGNVATGYTGTVHFTSSDPAATLPADTTFAAGDLGSHAFAAGAFAFATVGPQTLTATDTQTPAITFTSGVVTVSSGGFSNFTITNLPASAPAYAPLSPTVSAVDASGNPTSYTGTITFTSSDPQAVLPAPYTFTNSDQGTHTFPGMLSLETVGAQTVTITDGTGATAFATITIETNPLQLTGLSPADGGVSGLVTLTGSGFDSVTAVSFNGTAAAFTIASNSQVNAYVPDGASSGDVLLTSSEGSDSTPFSVDTDLAWALSGQGVDAQTGATTGPLSAFPDGTLVQTGYFSDGVTLSSTTLTNPGPATQLAYVSRWNSDGSLQWADAIPTTAGQSFPTGTAAFPDGTSAVSGYIGNGSGYLTNGGYLALAGLSEVGGANPTSSAVGYVARFDGLGNPTFAYALSDAAYQTHITALTAVAGGALGAIGDETSAPGGSASIFLLTIDSTNANISHLVLGSGVGLSATCISSYPNGDYLAGGTTTGPAAFSGNDVTPVGDSALWLGRFTSTGLPVWLQGATGVQAGAVLGCAITPDGGAVASGYFEGSASFGTTGTPVAVSIDPSTPPTAANGFVFKADSSGNILWADAINGATGQAYANSVAVAPDGSVVTGGTLSAGPINFSATVTQSLSANSQESFAGRYGSNGTFLGLYDVVPRDDDGTSYSQQQGLDIGSDGSVFLGGQFGNQSADTIQFGGDLSRQYLSSQQCNGSGACVTVPFLLKIYFGNCVPEDDATFCSDQFATCGALTALDLCGNNRTVASCGSCGPADEACGVNGALHNTCGVCSDNIQTDPNNCGGCGNICTSGACGSGSCVDLPLANGSGQYTAGEVITDIPAGSVCSIDGATWTPCGPSFTLTTSGTYTVMIDTTGAGNPANAISTVSITVDPGPAVSLVFTGVPSAATVGVAFSPQVIAQDAYQNVATGYLGMVQFTSTDGAASLPTPYTFLVSDAGQHTFTNGATLSTVGTQTLTATDTVLTVTSGPIAVSLACGGNQVVLAGSLTYPSEVAVDDTYAYFSMGQSLGVTTLADNTTTYTSLIGPAGSSGGAEPLHIVAGGEGVYASMLDQPNDWFGSSSDGVLIIPKGGGTPTAAFGGYAPSSISINDGELYLTDGDYDILNEALTGGAPTQIAAGYQAPGGVAVDTDGSVFWAGWPASDKSNYHVIHYTAGNAVDLGIATYGLPSLLSLGGNWIVLSEFGQNVFAIPKAGPSSDEIEISTDLIQGKPQTDGTYVYWAVDNTCTNLDEESGQCLAYANDGHISRAPVDGTGSIDTLVGCQVHPTNPVLVGNRLYYVTDPNNTTDGQGTVSYVVTQ